MDNDKTQVMTVVQVEEEVDLSDCLHNDPASKVADVLYSKVIGPIVGFCERLSDKMTAPWNTEKVLAQVQAQEAQDDLDKLEASSK